MDVWDGPGYLLPLSGQQFWIWEGNFKFINLKVILSTDCLLGWVFLSFALRGFCVTLCYWWKHHWRRSNLDVPFRQREVCTQTGPTPKCFHFPRFSCEIRASISSKGWQTALVQRAPHHIFTCPSWCTWRWAGPKGHPWESKAGLFAYLSA